MLFGPSIKCHPLYTYELCRLLIFKYSSFNGSASPFVFRLKSLPETVETPAGIVKVHQLLLELNDLDSDLAGNSFDIGIKRGFSLAVKFICHTLSL